MYTISLSLATTLLLSGLLAVAIPLPSADSDSDAATGQWMVSDAHRTKSSNNTVCSWHLRLSDPAPAPNTPGSPTTTYTCDFTVVAPPGQDCGDRSWTVAKCSGNNAFVINGGHSPLRFVVMVIVNAVEKSQAFFGFPDLKLDTNTTIAPQIVARKPLGASSSSSSSASAAAAARAALADFHHGPRFENTTAAEWTVANMYRHSDPTTHAVNMSFGIRNGAAEPFPCYLNLQAPEGNELATWSFYDEKCNNSDWTASWGYTTAGDAGIMTLVDPARKHRAFFGFHHINKDENLGTAGPSPVEACDC
ncbi:Uu.00g087120.m01.CDS01 [Anthostomella pinea]|uniref:Uu.00g087120.m01.CDS01 n=1 Tax=Anthostomella pinea TaxID=933095 RepID=A0AAI8VN76_9PEZI|nr:Uu.00g087120.m01.CDS01 [Anthostomella pinea]